MLALSIWAKRHPGLARLIIAFSHVALALLSLEAGLLLFARGMRLPAVAFYAPLGLFTLAYLAYPKKAAGGLEALLALGRRRLFDGLLFASLGFMWLSAGNALPLQVEQLTANQPQITLDKPVARGMLPATREAAPQGLAKMHPGMKKGAKWLSRRIERKLERYSNNTDAPIAGIIILGVLLSVILGFLTLGFSCSLSCAGNDGAAVLVILLGAGLIGAVWVGMVKWMRKIKEKARAAPKNPASDSL